MNKPIYLELSILELSKILMYGFWYDYVKPKYGEKSKLCYYIILLNYYICMVSFYAYINTGDIYTEITEDVETRHFKLIIRYTIA